MKSPYKQHTHTYNFPRWDLKNPTLGNMSRKLVKNKTYFSTLHDPRTNETARRFRKLNGIAIFVNLSKKKVEKLGPSFRDDDGFEMNFGTPA